MKKIAIFTMGTRGDVQPYIYLAQELNKNDCQVVIGSHPCWRELVESENISPIKSWHLPIPFLNWEWQENRSMEIKSRKQT